MKTKRKKNINAVGQAALGEENQKMKETTLKERNRALKVINEGGQEATLNLGSTEVAKKARIKRDGGNPAVVHVKGKRKVGICLLSCKISL